MRLKLKKEEDGIAPTDRYLLTYADLITLLLGLFVILYASSQVDEGKYKEFSAAFSEYFKKNAQVNSGGAGVLTGRKDGVPEPILSGGGGKSLDDIYRETEDKLQSQLTAGDIQVKRTANGITVTLPEKLLFQPGKADIQSGGVKVIDSLANIFSGINYQFTVDGHTDSDPIRSFRYESNWHLSVSRALTIGYTLIQKGMSESNVVIRGFGSQRPLADNSTVEGKALNRRVEITISELPSNAPSVSGYDTKDSVRNSNTKK